MNPEGAMMTRRLLPFFLFALVLPATACTQAVVSDADLESIAESSDAIRGVAARDTRFAAVGRVFFSAPGWTMGCTGTLIGPRTVLTAAHCVAPVAKGCAQSLLLPFGTFRMTPSGDLSDANAVTYAIEEIRANPNAYARLSNPSTQCFDTTTGAITPGAAARDLNIFRSDDIALLRIKIDRRLRPPDAVATPMEVVTSLNGGAPTVAGAVHPVIDTAHRFGVDAKGVGADATVMGFGLADDGNPWRRSGLASFTQDANWDANDVVTLRHFGVWLDVPTVIGPEKRWVALTATPAPGDSGGPLVIVGGTGAGQVPELPSNRAYSMGVLSSGNDKVATTRTTYAETFGRTNRFLIEVALGQWAGSWTPIIETCKYCKLF
jgi:hypothetical protein